MEWAFRMERLVEWVSGPVRGMGFRPIFYSGMSFDPVLGI